DVLNANMPHALIMELSAGFLDLGEGRARGMSVSINRFAALASKKLIDRQAGALAENVPQSHVHAALGVAQHRAVPPIGADEGRLPDVLDLHRVFADQKRLKEMIDGRLDRPRPLSEGGAAQSKN